MSRFLGVAAVQRQAFEANADKNITEIENTIDMLSLEYPWLDLIVFPECTIQGLAPELKDIAEPIPGLSTQRLAKKAAEVKKWIVPGSMIELEDDKVYNTIPVFSPEGELVTKYRKMNPFSPMEASEPGNSFTVFDIPNIGRLGILNCYDLCFPEMSRTLVSMGAEVIIHPSFAPSGFRDCEWLNRRTMAMLNQVYLIGAGSCGVHGGCPTAGHSMIVDPEGVILQEAGDTPAIQTEMLDLDKVTLVREIGYKGAIPMLKHLNYFAHQWPVYGNQIATSPYIKSLDSPLNIWTELNKN